MLTPRYYFADDFRGFHDYFLAQPHKETVFRKGELLWKPGQPYQCAPFIGFPRTLNAISAMNEVFRAHGIELPLPKQGTLSSSEERYEKGLAIQEPVYGTEIKERYTWLPGEFAQAVPRFLTELGFGDFNTRTGMDAKTRELLTVVILAAMGGAEVQVKSHVYGALKVGSSKEEVVCALVHAGAYMGIPRLFNALNACKELLQ